jgi:hypothetical protein
MVLQKLFKQISRKCHNGQVTVDRSYLLLICMYYSIYESSFFIKGNSFPKFLFFSMYYESSRLICQFNNTVLGEYLHK